MDNTSLKLQKRVKVLVDCIGSWIGLIVLSPIIYVIGILIRLDSEGPIFFRQERIGKDGRAFISYKFRSMVDEAEMIKKGRTTISEDALITRVGRYLRNTSLDELPQLFNVIKGDMSIVGPRPTLRYQVEAYDEFQRRRLEVKPGITGWAQINGRNTIPWEQRIILDVWYIDHWSLKLDLKILWRTLMTVINQEGIYGPGGKNYDFGVKSDS